MDVRDLSSFQGNERFRLQRMLGRGGMGVVYEAYDRLREETVALKTLHWVDAAAIYRFKQEFRALADVAHPNLVSLYELIAEGDDWFFTMELVDGVDLLEYVRPGGALDAQLLRSALRQLAGGLLALHQMGKLHRDLKPSNVLVTPEGRVVILDFGISADIGGWPSRQTREEGLPGTAAYMAPEQGEGDSSPASDWYAFGTILYEALTGRLPFEGSPLKVLIEKRERDPVTPLGLVADLPQDLVTLSMRLLARELERRPDGDGVLRSLGDVTVGVPLTMGDIRPSALVGREDHLAQLGAAFNEVRNGAALSTYVYGASGIGKTTLVQHFADRIARRGQGHVLYGRCYERESIPYKALDGVVDSLTRLLRAMPEPEAAELVPPDAAALARVFPVLSRVGAIAAAPQPPRDIPDVLEVRRRAFAALRELLARLSRRRPLVLMIDDLHWADADSALLLEDLLRPPGAPRLLLVACFRSEEMESQPFLQALLLRAGTPTCRALPVGPLRDTESRELARALLGAHGGQRAASIDVIVREAGGSPFLTEELTRYIATEGTGGPGVELAQMMAVRLRRLSGPAQRLLDVLAVAGRPLPTRVARDAAGIQGDERPLVAALTAGRFVRATGTPHRIELYHDRIRENLSAMQSTSVARDTHRAIAQALEANGFDDPEALLDHYIHAGDVRNAAGYAVRAAQKAHAALAFDRAVTYYERALHLAESGADLSGLREGLGGALASAGRGTRAAEAYLEAARENPTRAMELRRQAAEQLLISGHLEEGIAVIRTVLKSVGLKLARSPRRALLSLLLRRTQLRLRGLRFRERDGRQVPAGDLTRIDTCWAVAVGLAQVDNIRAADFQTRHLLLALSAGEPYRIARALAIEAGFSATAGGPASYRTTRLLRSAYELAERIESKHALALCSMIAGVSAYFRGQWRSARQFAERAERLLVEHLSGVAWELSTARLYQIHSLFFLGDVPQLAQRGRIFLRDALDRGNLFAATIFQSGLGNVAWLAADDVPEAARMLREAIKDWPQEEFRIPHYLTLIGEGHLHLYEGAPALAWSAVSSAWPGLQRSLLNRIQTIRVSVLHLRAQVALAAAAAGWQRAHMLQVADRDTWRVEREAMAWSTALAELLRAGAAASRSEHEAAVRLLASAQEHFVTCEMALYARAAQRRRGAMVGGQEGASLIAGADAWMRAHDIANPERMTAMLAPGFE